MKPININVNSNKHRTVYIISTHNIGLGLIRIFGEMNFDVRAFYYDRADMGYHSRYVNKRYLVPHPENETESFIESIIDSVAGRERSLLIPADDASLVAVSKNKKRLNHYFTVACTDWDITEKFIIKKHSYSIAQLCGIPSPRFMMIDSADGLSDCCDKFRFPVMVKPCQSHLFYDRFKVKMFKAHDFDELSMFYHRAHEARLEMMIQEYIPGDDTSGINYNSYFIDGKVKAEFTAQKIRLSPSESGVPSVVVSKKVPEVIEYGRELLRRIGFSGYSCMEFKKDNRDNVYKFMEINGRHNRSVLLAYKCGINFPFMQFDHLMNERVPESSLKNTYNENIYWIDEFRDVATAPTYLKMYRYNILRWIRPYFRKNIFATFNTGDLRPFFHRLKQIFLILISRFLKKWSH